MIGEKIKDYRKKRGLTQKDLAKLLEVEQQRLSEWERGVHIPRIDTLKKISEALEISMDDLLENVG